MVIIYVYAVPVRCLFLIFALKNCTCPKISTVNQLSEFLAGRKGLLPLIGIILVLTNLVLKFTITGWLVDSDLFLHLGIVIALLGFLLGWAL